MKLFQAYMSWLPVMAAPGVWKGSSRQWEEDLTKFSWLLAGSIGSLSHKKLFVKNLFIKKSFRWLFLKFSSLKYFFHQESLRMVWMNIWRELKKLMKTIILQAAMDWGILSFGEILRLRNSDIMRLCSSRGLVSFVSGGSCRRLQKRQKSIFFHFASPDVQHFADDICTNCHYNSEAVKCSFGF